MRSLSFAPIEEISRRLRDRRPGGSRKQTLVLNKDFQKSKLLSLSCFWLFFWCITAVRVLQDRQLGAWTPQFLKMRPNFCLFFTSKWEVQENVSWCSCVAAWENQNAAIPSHDGPIGLSLLSELPNGWIRPCFWKVTFCVWNPCSGRKFTSHSFHW